MGALIIVVSADERALRETEALLTAHGYLVGIASSFAEGNDLLDSVTPDLLIADLHLDDFNGLQLAIHGHLDHPDVAVVVTSASPEPTVASARRNTTAPLHLAPLAIPTFFRACGPRSPAGGPRVNPCDAGSAVRWWASRPCSPQAAARRSST